MNWNQTISVKGIWNGLKKECSTWKTILVDPFVTLITPKSLRTELICSNHNSLTDLQQAVEEAGNTVRESFGNGALGYGNYIGNSPEVVTPRVLTRSMMQDTINTIENQPTPIPYPGTVQVSNGYFDWMMRRQHEEEIARVEAQATDVIEGGRNLEDYIDPSNLSAENLSTLANELNTRMTTAEDRLSGFVNTGVNAALNEAIGRNIPNPTNNDDIAQMTPGQMAAYENMQTPVDSMTMEEIEETRRILSRYADRRIVERFENSLIPNNTITDNTVTLEDQGTNRPRRRTEPQVDIKKIRKRESYSRWKNLHHKIMEIKMGGDVWNVLEIIHSYIGRRSGYGNYINHDKAFESLQQLKTDYNGEQV